MYLRSSERLLNDENFFSSKYNYILCLYLEPFIIFVTIKNQKDSSTKLSSFALNN